MARATGGAGSDASGARETPPSNARRRGAALEAALLRAAWEELAAVGYANLTMEGVAARAGTGKAVLYRRWRNRAELVIAAMRQEAPMLSGPVPDTGVLRDDVLALLRRVHQHLTRIGQETIHGVLAEYFGDPDLASLWPQVLGIGTEAMTTILQRAATRGEVDLERVSPRIASLPIDLARHELLVTRAAVPDATLVEIVDDVFLPLVTMGRRRR